MNKFSEFLEMNLLPSWLESSPIVPFYISLVLRWDRSKFTDIFLSMRDWIVKPYRHLTTPVLKISSPREGWGQNLSLTQGSVKVVQGRPGKIPLNLPFAKGDFKFPP
ncbi:MAG: hypothetical protein A2169_08665 [Deltaproteobacteria bacterium RBG_13_47_9]|nr:MAG: hypothetical protein A2169_08665 [Deltaproteobacteria bacterium RBG_13_47_9]